MTEFNLPPAAPAASPVLSTVALLVAGAIARGELPAGCTVLVRVTGRTVTATLSGSAE